MTRNVRIIVNIAGLNVGWFACVLGAAGGYPNLGPAAVAVLICVHLLLARSRRREAVLIFLVGLLGTVVDSIQMVAGTMAFEESAKSPLLVPLWMIALWLNFATALTTSLGFLVGRPVISAAVGLLGGASAYFSGAKLGALSFPPGLWQGSLLIGLEWAVLLPLMVAAAAALCEKSASPAPINFGKQEGAV